MLPLFATILLAMAWVTIPMLPALLIHRACPDMVIVAGKVPGTGLTLNAAGAAAVYFLVFLLLISELVGPAKREIAGLGRPYWEVTGKVHFFEGDKEVSSPPDEVLNNMLLKIDPSNLSHNGTRLTLKIPEEEVDGDTWSFPTVIISFPKYSEWFGQRDLTPPKLTWWKFWESGENGVTINALSKRIDLSTIPVNKVGRPGNYDHTLGMDPPAALSN